MNKLKIIVASALSIVILAAGAPVGAQSANTCVVEPAKLGEWGKAITSNSTTATASFVVKGNNCTTPVTLAAWERPTVEGINDQKLFAHTTKTFAPGKHTLSVRLPECMWQVDVVEGSRATAADGTANYQFQNGQFVDGGLRDFKKGGTGICEKPEEPEIPVEQPKETPQTPVTPVGKLPSTGAGSIIASVLGLSTSTGLAYNYLISRKKLR